MSVVLPLTSSTYCTRCDLPPPPPPPQCVLRFALLDRLYGSGLQMDELSGAVLSIISLSSSAPPA